MVWLILGLALWSLAHLFKRIAPERRAAMGDSGRGAVALASLTGIVLMVIGYRMADGAYYWGRSPAVTGINNLLMLVSVYLFAASGMKVAVARRMRHPMLTAVIVWAVAHLLVNGDTASFVLFGGLLIWAVIEMVVINRAEPDWTPPEAAPPRKEIIAVVATVAIFGVIALIHAWLGYPVFG